MNAAGLGGIGIALPHGLDPAGRRRVGRHPSQRHVVGVSAIGLGALLDEDGSNARPARRPTMLVGLDGAEVLDAPVAEVGGQCRGVRFAVDIGGDGGTGETCLRRAKVAQLPDVNHGGFFQLAQLPIGVVCVDIFLVGQLTQIWDELDGHVRGESERSLALWLWLTRTGGRDACCCRIMGYHFLRQHCRTCARRF